MITFIFGALAFAVIAFAVFTIINNYKDATEVFFGLIFLVIGVGTGLFTFAVHYQEDRADFCKSNVMLSEYVVKKSVSVNYITDDAYNCTVTYYNKDLIKKDTSVTMIVTPDTYKIK